MVYGKKPVSHIGACERNRSGDMVVKARKMQEKAFQKCGGGRPGSLKISDSTTINISNSGLRIWTTI